MDALKWKSAGNAFGPLLRPVDLYLLEEKLTLHPILMQTFDPFRLEFNMATGQTLGTKADDRAAELAFTMKDDTATLPRITEIVIITRSSPWCTIVRSDRGVTLADVCTTLWKEYTDNAITEAEFNELPPREQDRVQRVALKREAGRSANGFMGQWDAASTVALNRCKRIDWLHGRVFFDGLERDDEFAKKRLGYAAANVFKLTLSD